MPPFYTDGLDLRTYSRGASWYKFFEPFGDATLEHKRIIDAFVDPIVAEARTRYAADKDSKLSDSRGYTFLDELMRKSDQEGWAFERLSLPSNLNANITRSHQRRTSQLSSGRS